MRLVHVCMQYTRYDAADKLAGSMNGMYIHTAHISCMEVRVEFID